MSDRVKELALQIADNEGNILALRTEISQKVAEFQTDLAQREAKNVELRAAMLEALEATDNPKQGYEDDNLKITYVSPTKRVGVNVAKLQLEQPAIFEKYKSTTNVKSSIRIKVK
jgi:hypothetical protein